MSIDRDKLAKRISEIQVAMDSLEKYSVMNADEFTLDDEKAAAAKYYLLTVIEGCISICTHISTKVMHKVPEGYGTCFKLLAENGLIEPSLGLKLSKMTGFRNLLIHQYWDIDDLKVHKLICSDLDDVRQFISVIGDRYLK